MPGGKKKVIPTYKNLQLLAADVFKYDLLLPPDIKVLNSQYREAWP